jgi:hypothetical protein
VKIKSSGRGGKAALARVCVYLAASISLRAGRNKFSNHHRETIVKIFSARRRSLGRRVARCAIIYFSFREAIIFYVPVPLPPPSRRDVYIFVLFYNVLLDYSLRLGSARCQIELYTHNIQYTHLLFPLPSSS